MKLVVGKTSMSTGRLAEGRLRLRFEYLLEEYKALKAEIRDYESFLRRLTEFALLLSGGLLALASKFGADLIGKHAERSYLLLLVALLYIGLTWATLEIYRNTAMRMLYIQKHLSRRIQRITGTPEGKRGLPVRDWEDYFRKTLYRSGVREIVLTSLNMLGTYALITLPALVLWAAFIEVQQDHGGLAWHNLSWEAQFWGVFNGVCGIITVPLVLRVIFAFTGREPRGATSK